MNMPRRLVTVDFALTKRLHHLCILNALGGLELESVLLKEIDSNVKRGALVPIHKGMVIPSINGEITGTLSRRNQEQEIILCLSDLDPLNAVWQGDLEHIHTTIARFQDFNRLRLVRFCPLLPRYFYRTCLSGGLILSAGHV